MAKKKSQTIKVGVKVIDVAVFNRSVIVMIGPIDQCRKLLEKQKVSGLAPDRIDCLFTHLNDFLASNEEGLGLTFNMDGDIYVYLRERDSAVCVHELYHAVQGILDLCGIEDDEEAGACLIGYLYEQIVGM